MSTSKTNAINAEGEVTPDFVGQYSPTYGIVAEVKRSLPKDRDHWQAAAKQLRAYDDTLTGWWTDDERIDCSDAALLIHQSRGRAFVRELQKMGAADPAIVGPRTSVIEFNHSAESVPFLFFRREFGKITNQALEPRLDEGVQVPLNKLVESLPRLQYYDAKPPMLVLLVNLWSEYFPSLASEVSYDEAARARRIAVSARAVTEELQRAYGSGGLKKDGRASEFPQYTWVREALDRLVEHKLAVKKDSESDEYVVEFKGVRKDPRLFFAEKEFRKGSGVRSKAGKYKQPSFLDTIDSG